MKATATFVGRVVKVQSFTNKNGKQAIAMRLEGAPMKFGSGKPWFQRVQAITYFCIEDAASIQEGEWVSVFGSADAETHEYQGKTFANLSITGQIQRFDIGGSSRSTSAPSTRTAQLPSHPMSSNQVPPSNPPATSGPIDDEEEIPF